MSLLQDHLKLESWMGQNWDLLADKPLYKLCMPGSHDTGLYEIQHLFGQGTEKNTKTQLYNILGQLKQGIRHFDIRPVMFKSRFYTAHYNDKFGCVHGALGGPLDVVLRQVKQFLSKEENKKELVILKMSHLAHFKDFFGDRNVERFAKKRELPEDEQQQLMNIIVEILTPELLVKTDPTNLANFTLREILELGNVIVVFPVEEDMTQCPATESTSGLWRDTSPDHKKKYLDVVGGASKTIDMKMMAKIQRDRMIQNCRFRQTTDPFLVTLCWQFTLRGIWDSWIPSSSSILTLADKANPQLRPEIMSWLDNGTINENCYPNFIQTDACCEDITHVVDLCIRICKRINGVEYAFPVRPETRIAG